MAGARQLLHDWGMALTTPTAELCSAGLSRLFELLRTRSNWFVGKYSQATLHPRPQPMMRQWPSPSCDVFHGSTSWRRSFDVYIPSIIHLSTSLIFSILFLRSFVFVPASRHPPMSQYAHPLFVKVILETLQYAVHPVSRVVEDFKRFGVPRYLCIMGLDLVH